MSDWKCARCHYNVPFRFLHECDCGSRFCDYCLTQHKDRECSTQANLCDDTRGAKLVKRRNVSTDGELSPPRMARVV